LKYALPLIATYLIGGVIYVTGDLKEHVVRQPAYIREYTQRGRILPLVLAAFTWLPITLLRRRFVPIVAFALLAILSLYLLNM
jgi:hypothetical protein